jgi:hypothetical protein
VNKSVGSKHLFWFAKDNAERLMAHGERIGERFKVK